MNTNVPNGSDPSVSTESMVVPTEYRAKVFDALSDPTRLRIVELLATTQEMSGSEIAHRLEISLALFCHHSRTLLDAGLIQTRRDGQTKYHSLHRKVLIECFKSFKGIDLKT